MLHARSGDADALAELLPQDVDIDPETLSRPLYFAAQRGHADAVAVLLDRGADPDTAFSFGGALHSAARADHTEVVAILLDAGADVDARVGEFKNTALHEAADSGAAGTVRLLLDAGADVNARDKDDQPPLHLAMLRDREEVVTLLLEAGAAPRDVPMPTPEALEAAIADPDAGWLAAGICRGCHQFLPDEKITSNYPGPTLVGIFGRPKASIPDFAYSDAMRAQEGAWTLEALNQLIGDLYGTVPGTQMSGFPAGMMDQERTALLALLTTLSAE